MGFNSGFKGLTITKNQGRLRGLQSQSVPNGGHEYNPVPVSNQNPLTRRTGYAGTVLTALTCLNCIISSFWLLSSPPPHSSQHPVPEHPDGDRLPPPSVWRTEWSTQPGAGLYRAVRALHSGVWKRPLRARDTCCHDCITQTVQDLIPAR